MFFDNASTTKIDKDVVELFKNFEDEYYYNPGAVYSKGRQAKGVLDDARISLLNNLGGDLKDNIVFTGSATEANNLAIFGVAKKNTKKIITSMGEHPSVYNSMLELKARGYDVEFVNLNKCGSVDFDYFKSLMTRDVDVVSIMHVSNETGAINDIKALCNYAKSINPKCIFHCDGVQAFGKIKVDVYDLGVDMYTVSAHKIHGPKGVGALYVKKGVSLKPIVYGGGQEMNLRSGTENVWGIKSLQMVADKVVRLLNENYKHVKNLRTSFLDMLAMSDLKYTLHSQDDNSPYIVSLSFDNCRAETILNMLDDEGICVGNGSACSAKNSGNRILENMGVTKSEVLGNLRISFSNNNTIEEVNLLVEKLKKVIEKYILNTK